MALKDIDICENCGKSIFFKELITTIEDTHKNKKYGFCNDSCAKDWIKKNNIQGVRVE